MGQSFQGLGPVVVQPQGLFEGADQSGPFLGAGEGDGLDDPEPSGDLPAPGAVEQPACLQVDAGIDKGRGDALVILSPHERVLHVCEAL